MRKKNNRDIQVKVVIIDDELHCIEELRKMIEPDKRFSIVGSTTDPTAAVDMIVETNPSLLLLDIQMPVTSGFDIIISLRKLRIEPFVIFVTAHDEFAIEAIRNSAFDYLLKPVFKSALSRALDHFFVAFNEYTTESNYTRLLEKIVNNGKLKFNTVGGFTLIDHKDIVFIKADWNYSEIYFSKEKFELVTMNLGALEKMLEGFSFIRINRSIIINSAYLQRVKRLSRTCFLQKEGVMLEFKISIGKIREVERLIS